jgi:hypothetical protein
MPVISAFVTNLGKYNEGELCGEYLKMPATRDDLEGLLARIGVDGIVYEEVFITDYETDIDGLSRRLGEYESIDELNYLAGLLSELDKAELDKFEAALQYGEYTGSVKDLINLSQNLNCYDYNPSIENNEDLGRYYVEEMGGMDVPKHLSPYIDYELLGRDLSLNISGVFTGKGYIWDSSDTVRESYKGRDDIPAEYKIFYYPAPEKIPVKQQLEMYGKMAALQPVADKPAARQTERD